MLHDPTDVPFERVEHVGIVIGYSQGEDRHTGFLYHLDNGEPRMAHVAFHFLYRDDPADPKFMWTDLVGIDAINKKVVASWIAARGRHGQNIPYGFDSSGSCFDPVTAEFIPPPVGKGLTCATFITGTLRSLGFALVSEATWPVRPEDAAFHARIIEILRCHASPEHVAGVQRDVGAPRIRPEEVAGSAGLPNPPVEFVDAVAASAQILEALRQARAPRH